MLFKLVSFYILLFLTTYLFISNNLKIRIFSIAAISLIASYLIWGKWTLAFLAISILTYVLSKTNSLRNINRLLVLIIVFVVSIIANLYFTLKLDAHTFNLEMYENGIVNKLYPFGVAIFIFRCGAYLLDVWSQEILPISNFTEFLASSLYFPQIFNGSFLGHEKICKYISINKKYDSNMALEGLILILYGLLKKVVISQRVYEMVLSSIEGQNSPTISFVTIFLLPVFVFVEYSSFIDILRGISKIFNINIESLYDSPITKKNFSKMLSSFNLSLSTWLNKHLNMPLLNLAHGKIDKFVWVLCQVILVSVWIGIGVKAIFIIFISAIFIILEKSLAMIDRKGIFSWCSAYVGVLLLSFLILSPHFHTIPYQLKIIRYGLNNFNFNEVIDLRLETKIALVCALIVIILDSFKVKLKIVLMRFQFGLLPWAVVSFLFLVLLLFYPNDFRSHFLIRI